MAPQGLTIGQARQRRGPDAQGPAGVRGQGAAARHRADRGLATGSTTSATAKRLRRPQVAT